MNINSSTDTKKQRYKCIHCCRKRYLKYLRHLGKHYDLSCHRKVDIYRCIDYCLAPGSEDNLLNIKNENLDYETIYYKP